MCTDYEWDVFFSYKRDPLTAQWNREVVNHVRFWLTQELGGAPARIFVDDAEIEVGDRWPEHLKQALCCSKCMATIWLPSYFQSAWCMSEWKSFLTRARRAQIDPKGLIAPMRFHDGEYFPEEARAIQWIDVSTYASTIPSFWTTSKAQEFLEDGIKPFARGLANMVRLAPPFEPDFPIEEFPGLPAPRIPLARL